MGQKTNPIGLRLGINKTWDSIWYDERNFADRIKEDLNIRNYILSKYESASEFVNSNPNCNLDNPILSMIKHKFMKPYISADIPFQLRNQKRLSNKSYNVIELDKYFKSL